MKRAKAMAAIMAATAVVSLGALPVQAADATVSAQEVQIMKEAIAEDAQVQDEVMAIADEAATTSQVFDWGGLTQGTLSATAYKVDLESVSMANDSLATGSSFVYDSTAKAYVLTIKTQSANQSFSDKIFSAKPKSATVTYYNANDTQITVACAVNQDANTITVSIPDSAKGFADVNGDIPGDYANMIKVKMTTTLEDNWLANLLFPEAMKAPTFYYAFDVE